MSTIYMVCLISLVGVPLYDECVIPQDYPSVGQIAQALRENDIIPIFAAEADALAIYEV